ncbi:MAG TPA: glycosyltransferase family 39 protein [Trebonia sp.]|nr:glycosyltransferase family 39 protein [Trebonia sp.]
MTLATITPVRRLAWRPSGDPRWARPLLAVLLAATAVAYLWGLSRNQWGNDFYAAAVQAGTRSWKAFLFGSFDASSFITVDKTPASLWVMELSGRIFGFSSWSLLVPQALEGVASVAVLQATVRRWFGPAAGLLAGTVLASTPVAALMFRFDNPDALLTLLLTGAAYAVTRALEQEARATRWLLVAGVLLGFGFLAKMLAAFLVVPGFAVAYLWAGPSRLWRRVVQLLWAGLGIAAGAGWWVAIAQLTPASARPYFGGSTDNSVLQLAIGYNGLGRLDGSERAGMAGRAGHGLADQALAGRGGLAGTTGRGDLGAGHGLAGHGDLGTGHGLAGHGGFGGSAGITRLLGPQFGGQVAWLLPTALLILMALLWRSRSAPRTDRTRAFALLWGGWLVVSGLTFSYMQGIIHPYYTLALTPAIAALVGVGARVLAVRAAAGGQAPPAQGTARGPVRGGRRPAWPGHLFLALLVAVTGWWEFELLARSPGWLPWLRWTIAVTAAIAALMIVAAGLRGPDAAEPDAGQADAGQADAAGALAAQPAAGADGRRRAAMLLGAMPWGLTLAAGLAGPVAYSVKTIDTTHTGGMPTAGPAVAHAFRGPGRFPGGTRPDGALLALVTANAARYRWVAATVGSMTAAPIELASGGDPVLAIGGFSGSDPAPTLRRFEALVAARQVHYYIARAGGGPGSRGDGPGAGDTADYGQLTGFGGGPAAAAIASWVAAHFTPRSLGAITVYNLTVPAHRVAGP